MKYEETIHNFDDSLKIEEENFIQQDNFYHLLFNQEIDINRIPFNEPESMKLQKDDIDLIINKKSGACKISEKVRETNYNDILFEIYADIEQGELGWSMISKSDFIFYFVKEDKYSPINSVYIISTEKIKPLLNHLTKLRPNFQWLIDKGYKKHSWDIPLNGEKTNVDLIIATNNRRYREGIYHSCSVGIKYEDLKKLGVNIKKYYLNEN